LLTEDELYLLEQRAEGRSWVEIADTLGVAADRIRKQASRAAERVACHMQAMPAKDSKHLIP
jgi:DNA-directed RNA polymerase specialized sigma24 family protein